MKVLQQIVHNINSQLTHIVPIEKLTSEQKREFYAAEICHICVKPFKDGDKAS